MANVINRSTLQYLQSVNTLLFPEPDWKANPDMSAVDGVDPMFWSWEGTEDRPVPMSPAAQSAILAARDALRRDEAIAEQVDGVESVLRQLIVMLVSEFNAHAAATNAILAAAAGASSLASFKTAMGQIANLPARTAQQVRTILRNSMGS